jgi:hypothetical protein
MNVTGRQGLFDQPKRFLISFIHDLSPFLGILGNPRVPAKNPWAGSCSPKPAVGCPWAGKEVENPTQTRAWRGLIYTNGKEAANQKYRTYNNNAY